MSDTANGSATQTPDPSEQYPLCRKCGERCNPAERPRDEYSVCNLCKIKHTRTMADVEFEIRTELHKLQRKVYDENFADTPNGDREAYILRHLKRERELNDRMWRLLEALLFTLDAKHQWPDAPASYVCQAHGMTVGVIAHTRADGTKDWSSHT